MLGLDYANSLWVRIYVDDGPDFEGLHWQAKAICMALWRKVNRRTGALPIGRGGPAGAIAAKTQIPVEVVQAHLPQLVTLRFVFVTERDVSFPEYQTATAANATPAARAKKYRQQKSVTLRDDVVTTDDGFVTRVTPPVTRERQEKRRDQIRSEEISDSGDSFHSSPSFVRGDAGASPRTRGNGQRGAREGSSRAERPDVAAEALTPRAKAALGAILADDALCPIVARPGELARDLDVIAPGVDLALEVSRAGTWLRSNPKNKKSNGSRYLTSWLQRQQERAPSPRPGGSNGHTGPNGFQPPPPKVWNRL